MKKIKAFFYVYYKSLTSVDYYKEIMQTNGWFAAKYFIALSFVFAILLTIKTGVSAIPQAQKATYDFAQSTKMLFPQDLEIKVENSKWEINQPEPFIFPMPNADEETAKELPKNLIVLYNKGTLDDINNFDTLMLINSKNILVKEKDGFKTYSLENLPNGQFTKADFEQFIDKIAQMVKWLPLLMSVFIFLGYFMLFILVRGGNLYFLAIPVWLLGKFTKIKPSYTTAIKITAHTATLPLTIYVISTIIGREIPFEAWFSVLNIGFAAAVLGMLSKADKSTDLTAQNSTDIKE